METGNYIHLGKPRISLVPHFISDMGIAFTPNAELFDLDSLLTIELVSQFCTHQLNLSNQALVKAVK